MKIHLCLHIQRRCPKRRGVKPGKRLGRGNVVAEKMVGRSSPTQGGESSPVGSLALRERDQSLAGQTHRRLAVGLRAELSVVSDSPCIDLTKVIRVDQLGQGFPPVTADSFRLRGSAGKQ